VDAATQAGAKRTYLIEEPVAAAIGAGIDISAPNGHMVVDIGGGTTDIAVLSLGGVVVSESIKVAGDKFDEAIIRYVRRKHNVLIGERTAEEIKIKIGSAWPREEPRYLDVKGRCLIQGLPRVVRIHSHEIPNALEEPLTAVIEAICSVIERTPPELIGDILSNGIVMTGGGSLLYGLDRLINYATDIRTRVADRPIQCVAIGTGKSLDNISHIPEGSINISRMRV
jgi:rod shape-determining protein MreB